MISKAKTPHVYIKNLPIDRQKAIARLRKVIIKNLPIGFNEEMNYGMIGYVVPHSIYPSGYHCNPKLPLPFIGIASQKHFVAVYHMGLYADKKLLKWLKETASKEYQIKLDMGKSCIRFKKINLIPYNLIGKLTRKMSVKEWICIYEKNIKKA